MKIVRLYNAERYEKTGSGIVTISFNAYNMTDKEIADYVKSLKEEMKIINKTYRLSKPAKNKKIDCTVDDLLHKFKPIDVINADKLKLNIDPDTGNTFYLIGSSKAGKSTLLLYLFEKYFKKKYINTLYSVNCHNKQYENIPIRVCRFDNVRPKGSNNPNSQDLIRLAKKINGKRKNEYDFMFILDDIINVRHAGILNEMILTLRNSKISSMVSLQYPKLLSKQARGSINNLFFFRLNNDESIIEAIDSFLGSKFAKLGVIGKCNQINYYKDLTKNHQFIYYHPSSDSLLVAKVYL